MPGCEAATSSWISVSRRDGSLRLLPPSPHPPRRRSMPPATWSSRDLSTSICTPTRRCWEKSCGRTVRARCRKRSRSPTSSSANTIRRRWRSAPLAWSRPGSATERRSSACSPTSEPSARCVPREGCCSCARSTGAVAISRWSPSRRKVSYAIREPPSCSTRQSSLAAMWSAACPGTSTRTKTRDGISTSASSSPSGTIATSTCWSTIPTTQIPAAWNISR